MEYYKSSLHPNFKTALSCLNLELEAEVKRYQKTVAADFYPEPEGEGEREENDEDEETPEVSKIAESEQEAGAENKGETRGATVTKDKQTEKKYIWGISSILLILMSGGLVLSYSGLWKILTLPATTEEKEQAEAKENEEGKIELGKISSLQPTPSISVEIPVESPPPAQPFVKTTPQPAVVASGNTGLVKVLLPPSLRTLPNENKPGVQTIPEEIPTQAKDNYYYVLAEYTGDRSLEQAQKVVNNAYLGKFPQGIRIHLGSFAEIEEANTLIEEVKQEGIVAFIYHRE